MGRIRAGVILSGFFSLLSIHVQTISVAADHRFHFVNELRTWYDAQRYCQVKYSDLATIHNWKEVSSSMATVDINVNQVWIGLERKSMTRWIWSYARESFYTAAEFEFRNWAAGEPNNLDKETDCTVMRVDGTWNNVACSLTKRFICFSETGNPKYVILPNTSNWKQAQNTCRLSYTDLVSVRSREENIEVRNMVEGIGESAWIGLFRDSWGWSDQDTSTFRYWNINVNLTGSGDCVAASKPLNGAWDHFLCDAEHTFICTGVLHSESFRVRMAFNSGADLTSSASQEKVLKELGSALAKRGISDVKLRWTQIPEKQVIPKQNVIKKVCVDQGPL